MVVNRRKKNRKLRGSRTYGWGSPKKHRGKGSRGGVGKSGMGKRGQHKMSLLNALGIKNLGSHGFVRPRKEMLGDSAINLQAIEANIDKWLAKKIASEEKGIVLLDMEKLGFDKVLGGGKISRKIIIKAEKFSAGAKEKIEKAGGKAEGEILEMEKEEITKPKPQEMKEEKKKSVKTEKKTVKK